MESAADAVLPKKRAGEDWSFAATFVVMAVLLALAPFLIYPVFLM